MSRSGAGSFHRKLERSASFRNAPQLLERFSQPILTLGIELAAFGIFLKLGERLFSVPQLEVGCA